MRNPNHLSAAESKGESALGPMWMFCVGRIIEGAMSNDKERVTGYAKQLAKTLEVDGQPAYAARIKRALRGGPKAKLCKEKG